jgi:hypothetical protein
MAATLPHASKRHTQPTIRILPKMRAWVPREVVLLVPSPDAIGGAPLLGAGVGALAGLAGTGGYEEVTNRWPPDVLREARDRSWCDADVPDQTLLPTPYHSISMDGIARMGADAQVRYSDHRSQSGSHMRAKQTKGCRRA